MGAKTILVVDDDEDTRDALRWALGGEGFAVETASDGREALAKLAALPKIGLVLLDLSMPVMSGWEMLEALDRNDIPVIVVSAHVFDAKTMAAAARIHQTAGFMSKPIDISKLIGVVRTFFPARSRSRSAP